VRGQRPAQLLLRSEAMVASARGEGAPRRGGGLSADERAGGVLGVFEEVVDAADEMALEAANRLFVCLPAGALFGDLHRGARVVGDFANREQVDRVVELAVAARVQAMAVGAPG